MIVELRNDDRAERSVDVLVIGGGTVGLVTAVTLAKRGHSVLCLESGGVRQDGDDHPLNEVVHAKRHYDGAVHGRFRCLGGTSTRWGGAMIPFQRGDVDNADWPIAHDDIVRFLPDVEALFGLQAGSYALEGAGGLNLAEFVPRLAKWPPFAKRNVATLCQSSLSSTPGLEIMLHATATGFAVENGRVAQVAARSLGGGTVTVQAREVVIAAGAIESTRLLLLMDRQNGDAVFAGDHQLGRYFTDHLSVVVAGLEPLNRTALNRLVGFRFGAKGTMRNLRFELSNDTALRRSVPPCFAHVAFVSEEDSGFNALRELLRFTQQRRIPPVSVFTSLMSAAPWLARAAWWRFIDKRLLYPDDARIELHMVTEQVPLPENRITLSEDRRDAFGLPLSEITWDVAPIDHDNIEHAVTAFMQAWEGSMLASIARVIRRPSDEVVADLVGSGGVFHPVGSTRMGKSAATAVVDEKLRPFRLSNTTVLATSVLPKGGGANPTMMLFLLAFRCMEQLTRRLRSPRPSATG